jgi:hypothetical protein
MGGIKKRNQTDNELNFNEYRRSKPVMKQVLET